MSDYAIVQIVAELCALVGAIVGIYFIFKIGEKIPYELEAALAAVSAVPPASPTKVPGLGTITDEDNGVLTLEFKDEDSAQAFMHSYSPTVEITEMPSRAVPPAKAEGLTNAAQDVLAERQRQMQVEGWSPYHDDQYQGEELRLAALCYMRADTITKPGVLPGAWPWAAKWWKPSTDRRNLVKAGALVLAEIERIDRAILAQQAPEQEAEQPHTNKGVADIGALQEQSEAWYAVCEVLNELRPGWMAGARTGIDAAVATIRDLATPEQHPNNQGDHHD